VLKIRRSETLTIQQVVSEVVVVKLGAFVIDYKTVVYFEVSLDFLTCGVALKANHILPAIRILYFKTN
jgi:hypothetical protein